MALAASLSGVSIRFGDGPPVVEDITLAVPQGECVAIVGPSGCGKSTLLRLIAGLLPPSKGQVNVETGQETSFVFQDPTLLPWLTVEDNAAVPLALRGRSRDERRERARTALARVGLVDRGAFFPNQLSGGQKMRTSLARALTLNPQLLLLDEPFGALDELTRDALNELLHELRAEDHWTTLLVTHSVSEAVFLADRILVMRANPGCIHREFAVDFGGPRTSATRTRADFHAQVDEVSQALREVTPVLS